MTLTSDEVNFLVYRYLLESGFVHSAFCFGNESHIAKSVVAGGDVPPGSLISFLQKGLQHTEIECHVNEDGTETVCDAPFSLLTKHQCNVKSKMALFDPDVPMEEDYGSLEIPKDLIGQFKGHNDVVFTCTYSPNGTSLISGSQECTSRLWTNIDDPSSSTCLIINEKSSTSNGIHLTSWSESGEMFATASISGECWIWSAEGSLQHRLAGHVAPITALRWSPNGTWLLTCSIDHLVIIWSVETGKIRAQYKCHTSSVLDCDWRNNECFISCSTDNTINLHELSVEQPVKVFKGHSRDVNCVKWCPEASRFASCSDDTTIKVWDPNLAQPICDLHGHGRDVCNILWLQINYEGRPLQVLASASLDCTVRIWCPARGSCLFVLSKHLHPVTSLVLCSSGEYLACGSHDRLFIWSCNDGVLIRTFKANGGVNCISWHPSGNRLALACANNSLLTVQFRP